MLTALQAKTHLLRYIGSGNDAYERLSLVIERLIKAGNFRGTKQMASFTVYADAQGNSVITLPPKLNTLLAGVYVNASAAGVTAYGPGAPLPVRNSWYSFLPNGPGVERGCCVDSFIEMPGRYVTFQDWVTPMLLRFKFEQSESAGVIIVRGTLEGSQIYSTYSANWIDGIAVAYTGSTTVTTTQLFDLPPTALIKPVTSGRVSMYTVDSTGTETLVAVYDPTETTPGWRRYRVPACTTPTTIMLPTSQFMTRAEILALFGDSAAIIVNSDGTQTLGPQQSFVEWNQIITAQAGSGAYTAKFVLPTSYPNDGALYNISIALAQSLNPTIEIYNGADNAVIQRVVGDSSNATNFYFQARWDGSNWIAQQRYYVP